MLAWKVNSAIKKNRNNITHNTLRPPRPLHPPFEVVVDQWVGHRGFDHEYSD
ncbi:hypothetical protein Sjap_024209 [Stephania japonica]|uniref:Uncharacterized protein n=1 Tax=Stephania japonica TaxID=461633 RepID=A0AAP0HNH5_9MAGN